LPRGVRVVSNKGPQQPTEEQLRAYIDEIGKCNNAIVQTLSKIVDEKQIAMYLYYLDHREALAESPKLAFSTGIGSVLRKQDIEYFCNERIPPLIDPLDRNCLKESASYELRLGSRYRLGQSGNAEWLTDSKKDLIIPPHGIAVVSTYEWLNIPGCLIGRWNLKVRMVYRGLVWVGSLQVDPGYQGFLFCPIYNLSNQQQILIYKDPLFIIDFVLTTPIDKYGLWGLRGGRYSTFDFDRLDEQKIDSAPRSKFEDIDNKMTNLKKTTGEGIAKLEGKIEHFQDTILIVIGIIVAALAIMAAFGITNTKWASDQILYVVAGVAVVLSAIAIKIAKRKKSE
jgi:deoxycytidine triphosphate deaminase